MSSAPTKRASIASEVNPNTRTVDPAADRQAREDYALTQAAARGEERAQTVLLERLFDRVRHSTFMLTGSHSEADDLAQQSLLQILGSAGTYQATGRLERWADRITLRTSMRQLKRVSRRRERPSSPAEISTMLEHSAGAFDPSARPEGSPELAAARQQLRRLLAQLLAQLAVKYRVVLVARLVHELSAREIAELTETPLNTVRRRLMDGKQKLRSRVLKDPTLRGWKALIAP